MSEIENPPKIRIIRMRNVPAIDATGLNLLGELIKDSIKIGVKIILSGVNSQPRNAMKIYGILNIIGEENVFDNIDDALERAKIILEE